MLRQNLLDVALTLERATTSAGENLVQMSEASRVLLVFLRHAGCTFCREALSDLARVRQSINGTGTRLVLVHMGDGPEMERLLDKHGLADVDRIVDSDQRLYRAFGLKKGSWGQLAGLRVVRRGVQAAIAGHGIGRVSADALQLPGLFVLHRGRIVNRFRHRTAADRPDYLGICAQALKACQAR